MAVSVERAIQRALQRHLESSLTGVTVWDHWPDASAALPERAITIVRASARQDIFLDPEITGSQNVHAEMPTRITAAQVVDLPTAIAALNQFKSTWNAHNASTDVHKAADAMNVVTSPDAIDLPTAIVLANEEAGDFSLHAPSTVFHDVGDAVNAITAPTAFDLGSLVARAEQLRIKANAHYVARHFLWRIRACELPLQLDVWARYESARDAMMADLETALNTDATADALDGFDPVRNGVLLDLQDDWGHVLADVVFDAPSLDDDEDATERGEWRATYRGLADFNLVVRAQSARLARIIVRQTVYQSTTVGVTPQAATLTHDPSGTPVEDFSPPV